jgi:maltooligosyltrehalose trehalohydrolase
VPRWLVGELRPTRPAAVRPTAAGGLGLHAQWDKAPGQSARQLIDQRLPRPRRTAALAEVVAGYRSPAGAAAVTALQDHDIVGNSPTGARLGSVASVGLAAAAAAIMLTLPTTALLFMGEEWAATSPFGYFVGFEDPQLLVAVRAGRRRELVAAGWTGEMADPGDPATRAAAVLDWAEPGRWPHRDLLAWYRTLLTLRRAGAWRVSDVDDGGLVLTLDGPARLVVNAGDTSARVALPGPGCTLITLGATLRPDPDRRHTEVPARSAALLR